MNSKAIGERTEGMILGKLMSLGNIVLMPFGNNQRYDLVIDVDSKFLKIQCKTATFKNGCVFFNTCSTNGFNGKTKNYRGQIDFFIVYCPQIQKFYQVPVDSVGIKSGILRVDNPNRTTKGCSIRWAKDFEI